MGQQQIVLAAGGANSSLPRMALLVCLAALPPFLGASTTFQIVDLGSLGGAISSAAAINEDGQAVGWAADVGGAGHAFKSEGGPDGLSALSSAESRAYGINGRGDVTGIRFDAYGNAEAVIWRADGTVSSLGGGNGAAPAYAMAINGQGVVAGANGGRAVAWSANGTSMDLNVRGTWSTAMAINERGVIAGTTQLASGGYRGFVTAAGANTTYLATLGGQSSYAQDINNNGWVAGGSTVALGYLRAFLYSGRTMTNLGTLGGGNSSAYGVNDLGQVVGFAQTADGESSAFLWQDGQMLDLNSLIAEDVGWRLLEASAINNAGQIVGRGLLGGVERAFRLDPTMPLVFSSRGYLPLPDPPLAPSASSADVQLQSIATASAVPEPSAWIMILIGLLAIAFGSRPEREA